MKRTVTISTLLLLVVITVVSYCVHVQVAERKRLWSDKVISVGKGATVKQALQTLGRPTSEWKTIPGHLSRYSKSSVTNFSRVLMFTRVNQGAFLYVDENDRIIGAEVFEQ